MSNRNISYLNLRDEVLRRYDNKCACCKREVRLEIHHIVPVSLGGSDEITNLVPLCESCHKAAHIGRNIHEFTKHECGEKGGRSYKISFADFDREFQKYIDGRIGKAMFCKLVGYSLHITKGNCPHYRKSMEIRGIEKFRNNIDIISVNSDVDLKKGDVVGYILYKDWERKPITYMPTGENEVEYSRRYKGAGAGNCVTVAEKVRKTRKRKPNVILCDGQTSIFDFGVCG